MPHPSFVVGSKVPAPAHTGSLVARAGPLPHVESCSCLTLITVVIHQDDFLQQVRGRVVDSTVHGAQNHRQSLVDKNEDDGYRGQILGILQLLTPGREKVDLVRERRLIWVT